MEKRLFMFIYFKVYIRLHALGKNHPCKMHSRRFQADLHDTCNCVVILARDQETIEFKHSIQIEDLYAYFTYINGEIRGLIYGVTDIGQIAIELLFNWNGYGEKWNDCGTLLSIET